MSRLLAGLLVFAFLFSACGGTTQSRSSREVAESAARSAVVAWAVSRGVETRELDAVATELSDAGAQVRLSAELRSRDADRWETVAFVVPVSREPSNAWIVPATSLIDRLIDSARAATAVASTRATAAETASPTAAPPTATPASEGIEIPPPPAGDLVYLSDWSQGLDGWIGTPDWQVVDGKLTNDGTRTSREPWIEAPVHVEPWQAMIVEVGVEVLAEEYGSFGLVARGSNAGWLELGLRWQPRDDGGGTAVVALGGTIRHSAELVQEEWFSAPLEVDPRPHLLRFEFVDGMVSMFVDGVEVGEIEEGTFAAGEFMGFWSEATPLELSFFRVTVV